MLSSPDTYSLSLLSIYLLGCLTFLIDPSIYARPTFTFAPFVFDRFFRKLCVFSLYLAAPFFVSFFLFLCSEFFLLLALTLLFQFCLCKPLYVHRLFIAFFPFMLMSRKVKLSIRLAGTIPDNTRYLDETLYSGVEVLELLTSSKLSVFH